MSAPEAHRPAAGPAGGALSPCCSYGSCAQEARWRQFNPPSRSHPLFLCTEHWLVVRMERPELIVAYGWLATFPKSDLTDPYRSSTEDDASHAAFELPRRRPWAGTENLVGDGRDGTFG